MTTLITAAQALEWAKEDVEALPSGSYAEDATDILDRWIKRVEDTKPKLTYRDGGPLGTIAVKNRDADL